jgi:hypothetical protein
MARWAIASFFMVFILGLPAAWAQDEQSSVREGQVTTLVGTITAVAPGSQTVVVDVPLKDTTITVGATGVPETRITEHGKASSFEQLQPGAKVRVTFRRASDGDQLLALDVLGQPTG